MATTNRIRKAWNSRLASLVLTLALIGVPSRAALGAEHSAPAKGAHGGEAKVDDPKLPKTFDVGAFDLRNFRPTHNEIANVQFSLQLVLAPGVDEAALVELENWKHRLRDQAITAVRSADPQDLADPKLARVQKIILLRLKRMPLPEPVTGIYLTDFAVSSG